MLFSKKINKTWKVYTEIEKSYRFILKRVENKEGFTMKQNIKVRPDILDQTDAISITKENKTNVDYFLFDTFEIHKNMLPVGCVQDWHQHSSIEEIILINSGTLLLERIENG